MKQEIIDFRKEIAALEVEQRNAKEQRKTVRFTGERTMSPGDACNVVRGNKEDLRAMYAAYGLMRGKKISEIENNAKPLNGEEFYKLNGYSLKSEFEGKHPLVLYGEQINKYLEKYGYKLPYEEITKKSYWGGEYKEKIYNLDYCEKVICISEQTA